MKATFQMKDCANRLRYSNVMIFVLCYLLLSVDFATAQGEALYADFGLSFKEGKELDKSSDVHIAGFPRSTTRGVAESQDYLWWATQPDIETGITTARTVKFRREMIIRFKADALPKIEMLYFTIRFKDDVYQPIPILIRTGLQKNGWVKAGAVAGSYDHNWKTVQAKIQVKQWLVNEGYYDVKLGKNYSDVVIGELPVDRVKLGTTADRKEFPDDAAGYWPEMPERRFQDIGGTMAFIPGEGAFFPYGIYDSIYFSDGGSESEGGSGENDTWQIWEDAGFNCYVIHGWKQNWFSGWRKYPKDKTAQWSESGLRVEPGLKEHLIQANSHGLKVIPNFLTDTRSYWIDKQYGGEGQALEALGRVAETYNDDPNLLCWYPIDEWDHEQNNYGKPHLYGHLLYRTFALKGPDHPGFCLSMAFHGPNTWKVSGPLAQVHGVDVYLHDNKTTENGLAMQAKRLDEMRSVFGRKVPYIMVPACFSTPKQKKDPQRLSADSYEDFHMVAQAYLGIVHGARGIIFFRDVHPKNPKCPEGIWRGMKQVGEELFDDDDGIASLLLPPSRPVEFMGEAGVVSVSHSAIHQSLFVDEDGKRTLIALNTKGQQYQDVTFNVKDLSEGTDVRVRFEDRSVASKDGSFSDTIGPFERRVYDLQ